MIDFSNADGELRRADIRYSFFTSRVRESGTHFRQVLSVCRLTPELILTLLYRVFRV